MLSKYIFVESLSGRTFYSEIFYSENFVRNDKKKSRESYFISRQLGMIPFPCILFFFFLCYTIWYLIYKDFERISNIIKSFLKVFAGGTESISRCSLTDTGGWGGNSL